MNRDQQSMLDMLHSARLVMSYIAGRSVDELETDLQFQDSVIHRLLIIGEASNRVSQETQQEFSDIPWIAVNGMRNRLIHEYDDIDLDIVWETVTQSLPVLIQTLETVLSSNS